ncbi:MAG: DNA topoisomerase III [Spirochaetales bacterium]|nr:DNA topoisomerase III [Spirochaetales bacterium]
MGKTIVLAEKPSVARDLARVLGCSKKGESFLEGSQYVIVWGLGHLVELATPDHYDKKYEKWALLTLPMLPEKLETVVIKKTGKHFYRTKSVIQRQDIGEMIIATDAGREGELVARWILEKAGWKKPFKRLWISSQTDRAIRDGFARLRPGSEYDNLYQSAKCRAESDWLVGLNATRAMTCKFSAQLSAGRVQTPTLALVVQREKEIRSFVPKDYWMIEAKTGGFTLRWIDKKTSQTRIFNRERAEAILDKIKGKPALVTEIKKEAKKEPHPLAYDLTELQRDANKRYGYSAKKTLSIMQRLYERHKLVTYPRTDSRHITEDIVPTLKDRLQGMAINLYSPYVNEILKKGINVTKRFVDGTKVSDHHAIIPTEQDLNMDDLASEEKNVYDLIAKRFLSVFYPPFEYDRTQVKATITDELFTANGKRVKHRGWKAVYGNTADQDTEEEDEEESKDQHLPELREGQSLKITNTSLVNNKTKPPARYTEATLLSAMEHAGKFIDDKALRDAMAKTSGLGTPATRAEIIEKLFDTFYMERRDKQIVPTSKGIQLISLVPEDLKSPELTARWEQKLQKISSGSLDPKGFIREMRKYAASLVEIIKTSKSEYHHDNITRDECPQCGKNLLAVSGKRGKMLVCPDRDCGYRKNISMNTNARCPVCHKKMEMTGEGDKKSFRCSCGHRESLKDFQNRKGEKVNKREVNRFLKNQDEDEGTNYTLADALSKWKDKKKRKNK